MADNTPAAPTPAPIVVRLPSYTRTEQQSILGDGADPFGVAGTGLSWLGKDEHFGVLLGERLVAHAGLVALDTTVGDVATPVIGVGGVAVAPEVRGRGLARLVLDTALAHARTMGSPPARHALLFCRPPLVPMYRRLGWHPLDTDVLVEQPEARVVTMPLATMVAPLHEGASWPAGPVRLLSLPM